MVGVDEERWRWWSWPVVYFWSCFVFWVPWGRVWDSSTLLVHGIQTLTACRDWERIGEWRKSGLPDIQEKT